MYGGSGTWPWRSSTSSTSPSKRKRKRSPSRPTTAASTASARRKRAPGCGGWLALIWASASFGPSTRSISTSIRPPVSLTPKSRALTTRVSLNTSTSPAERNCGRSEKAWSETPPCERRSRRLAVRSGAGCCAMSSLREVVVEVVDGERALLPVPGHSPIMPRPCRDGETGRRTGLKIRAPPVASPAQGAIIELESTTSRLGVTDESPGCDADVPTAFAYGAK